MNAIHVFDLSLAISGIRTNAYFAAADGKVYSRISTNGRKVALIGLNGFMFHGIQLDGANTVSGRYFTFATTNRSYYNERVTYAQGILQLRIRDFLAKNGLDAQFVKGASAQVVDLSHFGGTHVTQPATNFEFYVIAKLVNGNPAFSSGPKVHTSSASAKAEAQRLAAANPGNKFMIFKATNAVSVGSTVWESE